MKYTIEVNGRGGENFIHKLTEEKYETLQDGGVEDNDMSQDQISEVLGTHFLEAEEMITGIYTGSDNISITVKDESDEVVWESEDDFDFEEYENYYQFNDTHYLSVEDYQKGNFFNYTLETDEEFNPEMLVAVLVELLDGCSELITDIKYKEHEMIKDYGDTSSKGFTYMLN
jgi:hypothetical protein